MNAAPDDGHEDSPRAWVLATLVAGLGLSGFLLYLCPFGSWPVGYDVFWNLNLVSRIAESGLPESTPEAAFTPFATQYADRQLAFHYWLALLGVQDATEVTWGLLANLWIQVLCFAGALRLLAPRVSSIVLLLLPLVSASWLFRLCALRDLPFVLGPLVLLLALLSRRAALGRLRPLALAGLASFYVYGHAALPLPLGLSLLVLLGRRLEEAAFAWRDGLCVLAGILLALVARPDIPEFWSLLWTLNVSLPVDGILGRLAYVPLEYQGYSLSMLLRWELGSLIAALALLVLAWRRRARWGFLLPALVCTLVALFSRRFFEVSGPLLLLALCSLLPRFDTRRLAQAAVVLGLAALALPWSLPIASRSAEANRQRSYPALARFLLEEGRRGDLVFTFDWADSAGLAWATRGSGLRFTGMTDPSLMRSEDPERFADWVAMKEARAPDPVRVLRERFGARFVLIDKTETPRGRPDLLTAGWLYEALARAHAAGLELAQHRVEVDGQHRFLWRLGPPSSR